MSIGAAFPFDLLHAEIVQYANESEKERCSAKEKWKQVADTCVDVTELDKYDSLVHQAFAYSNAETQLEAIGYRVGYALCERISKDAAKLLTELEVVKFICKELWSAAFGKQVDNLRTNHQGVYVVQDNRFCTLTSLAEGAQWVKESAAFLALPSGVVRGALANLNIQSIVTPTVELLPSVKFHIHIQQKAPPATTATGALST